MKRCEKRIKGTCVIMIGVTAFLCAMALAEFRNIASKIKVEEWLLIKKYGVISCYAYGLTAIDYSLPRDKNNGNSCPHQTGATYFLSINRSKRNKIHKC
jgi:hypothetical protein